jgi:hypothetical protein
MAKTATDAVAKSDYTPTKSEAAALQRFDKRRNARRQFPKLQASTDAKGTANISSDHADELVAQAMQHDALGIVDPAEFTSLIKGVFNFTTKGGKADVVTANEAFQLIVGLEPQNTTEALLATQMVAIHLATMDAARRMHTTPNSVEAAACNAKILNNLARTFATQTEAMKKLKGGGQQKVVVEHKHYYLAPGAIANSNAVLGDVSQGRGTNEISGQPHEPEAGIPERSAVHGHLEANGLPLPGTGSEWLEGLPLSRGEGRRPERIS